MLLTPGARATQAPARAAHVAEPVIELRRHARSQQLDPLVVITAVALGLIAAVLRLTHIETSYNLFIDETTYAAIARDTTLTSGPMLHGVPFVLHPPLAFLLLAIPAHVLHTQNIATLIGELRPFVALVGSLTVSVLYLLLRRAGLRRAAIVAAAFVALDPLIISYDSEVMLEAFAQLFTVLTVTFAIRAATAGGRGRWRWTTLTAIAGAATFGTKETFGLVVFAMLVAVALTARRGRRISQLVAAAGMLLGYALINVAMVHWAGFGAWWYMRTSGLFRLLGVNQPTGFRSHGAPSFVSGVLANAVQLSGTYAILAAGGICALSLLWSLHRRRPSVGGLSPAGLAATRIVAIWALCSCGYLAYAVAFGSLEEQMFYITAAPCAAALALRAILIPRGVLRRCAAIGLTAIMAAQSLAWVEVHTTRDDVYGQLLARIADVAPRSSTVAVTEETAQFVLTGYRLGQWDTAAELKAHHVDFVLLSEHLVDNGYGLATRRFAKEVKAHSALAMSVSGRDGDLELYDVRAWTNDETHGGS